jgi:hypothetical protein
MNCKKCNKKVSETEINFQETLPANVGYPSPTTAKCNVCKNILCEECFWGWGHFVFTCGRNSECYDIQFAEQLINN